MDEDANVYGDPLLDFSSFANTMGLNFDFDYTNAVFPDQIDSVLADATHNEPVQSEPAQSVSGVQFEEGAWNLMLPSLRVNQY